MTAAAWAAAADGLRTNVRLMPVPLTEPPADALDADDASCPVVALPAAETAVRRARSRAKPMIQGTLALVAPPPARRGPRTNDPAAGRAADDLLRPDVRRWAMLLAQGIVEVASGERPMSQLSRWTTPEVYESLRWTLTRALTRRTPRLPGSPHAARALSVHVSPITPTVAEVCATIRLGPRVHALAYRLEATGTDWRCTAADVH